MSCNGESRCSAPGVRVELGSQAQRSLERLEQIYEKLDAPNRAAAATPFAQIA
jgi:hypothetical protein